MLLLLLLQQLLLLFLKVCCCRVAVAAVAAVAAAAAGAAVVVSDVWRRGNGKEAEEERGGLGSGAVSAVFIYPVASITGATHRLHLVEPQLGSGWMGDRRHGQAVEEGWEPRKLKWPVRKQHDSRTFITMWQ